MRLTSKQAVVVAAQVAPAPAEPVCGGHSSFNSAGRRVRVTVPGCGCGSPVVHESAPACASCGLPMVAARDRHRDGSWHPYCMACGGRGRA